MNNPAANQSQVKERLTRIRELAHRIREEAAAALLAPDAVMEMLSEAAAHGRTNIIISPAEPMSLQLTRAARDLDKLLGPLKVATTWTTLKVNGLESCELEIRLLSDT